MRWESGSRLLRQQVGAGYRGVTNELAGTGAASVFGSDRTASADVAALINGGLIHSLEYDDTHTGSIVHGSAVLAAVALAVGQTRARPDHRCSLPTRAAGRCSCASASRLPGHSSARAFRSPLSAERMVAALVAADIAGLDEDARSMPSASR